MRDPKRGETNKSVKKKNKEMSKHTCKRAKGTSSHERVVKIDISDPDTGKQRGEQERVNQVGAKYQIAPIKEHQAHDYRQRRIKARLDDGQQIIKGD